MGFFLFLKFLLMLLKTAYFDGEGDDWDKFDGNYYSKLLQLSIFSLVCRICFYKKEGTLPR